MRTVSKWLLGMVLTALLAFNACTSNPLEVRLEAQSLPLTVTYTWNPSVVDATHTAPNNYVFRLDGVIIGSPTGVTQVVTFNTAKKYTLSVVAVNDWGTSGPLTLIVDVFVPNDPTNLRKQ